MLTLNEKKATDELKKILLFKYSLIEFKLFGSKARDKETRESDIDIFIVVKECNWVIEKDIYELCFELSLKYDVLLSPVIYSKEDIQNNIIQATPFYQTIVKEGVSI